MSKVTDSGALPPTGALSPSTNNQSSVPGHYINTSSLLAQSPDTQHLGENSPEIRESNFLSNGVDSLSDVGELDSDVEDIEDNGQLFDSYIKREIENGGVSKRTLAFEDPAESQYNNSATMDQEEIIEKPRPTRKYLQRKRLKLLLNKVMEKFKANVKNQRPIRLHMNVKPKQAWDYGPLTTGAYNDIGDMFYTVPLTEWTIEGQINADESDKAVVDTQEDLPREIGSPEKEERRFNSPSTDNITVLADAYIVDTDDEKNRGEEETVNVQDIKSRATSAAAVSIVANSLGPDPAITGVSPVTCSGLTSTPATAPLSVSASENVTSTSVDLTAPAENTPLHITTISTGTLVARSPSPTKGLVKSSPVGVTPSDKPIQRSAPVNKVNNAITFISSTYEKPKPNVTFARSTTSIPININPIHSAPPSTEAALQREDTWGSRAPLPSLASHDSMKFDEEGSETSSSSPQNKRKIIVTLPDISTDVEDRKKVLHTQVTQSEPRNAFPSAKTSKSLPKHSQKVPPNYTLEGSARTLARKQSDLPTLKITSSNEEALSSSLFRIAPGNTSKGSIEIVTSENASAGSDSVSSPEVIETIQHATPMVASIPKLHGENPLLSVKGTNVSNSNPIGECTADSSSSESVDLSKNMLGNRLSIVIVNRKRAKACRQRHKRKSAHQSEPEMRLYRSSYTRRNKDMEYTGPFIERSKTLEFPSLAPGKVWNPDLEASATRTNPENHKDPKKSQKSPKLTCLRGHTDKEVNPLGSVPQASQLNGHMSDFLYRVFVRQSLASQTGSAGKKPTPVPLPEVPSTYKPFRSLTFVQSNPSVRLYRQPNWSPDKTYSADKLGIVNNPSFVVL